MTTKQTKIAVIIATIVIALLLLLPKKALASIVQDAENMFPNATSPSTNLSARNISVTIPGLPNYSPYQYSPISPCMCNGAAVSASPYSGPLVSFVTNEGSRGGNTYNYISGGSNSSSGGLSSLTGVYTG